VSHRARIVVDVHDGDVGRALRTLKKLAATTGLQRETTRRAHYVKPGEARRVKSRRARVRKSYRRAALFDFDGPVQGSGILRRMPPSPRI